MIFDRAYELHRTACRPFVEPWIDRRLARPFDTPADMPPHVWRVSWDVMQALTEASPPPTPIPPPPTPIPNPKSSDGATRLLFGWPIEVDKTLPNGSMELVAVAALNVRRQG